jgi:hypothetical protein
MQVRKQARRNNTQEKPSEHENGVAWVADAAADCGVTVETFMGWLVESEILLEHRQVATSLAPARTSGRCGDGSHQDRGPRDFRVVDAHRCRC